VTCTDAELCENVRKESHAIIEKLLVSKRVGSDADASELFNPASLQVMRVFTLGDNLFKLSGIDPYSRDLGCPETPAGDSKL
jgi:hypothetical protein